MSIKQNPLEQLVIVTLEASLYTGQRKLDRNFVEFDDSVPKSLCTGGAIRVFPAEALRPLASCKRRMERALSENGLSAHKGYVHELRSAKEVVQVLDKEVDQFRDLKTDLLANYDQIRAEWIDNNPEFEWVRDRGHPASYVDQRVQVDYSVARIVLNADIGKHAQSEAEMAGSLATRLLNDIAAESDALITTFSEGEVRATGVKRLVKLKKKMSSFRCLDSAMGPLVHHLDACIRKCPSSGVLEGSLVNEILLLLAPLVDPTQVRSHAHKIATAYQVTEEHTAQPVSLVAAKATGLFG